MTDRKPGATPSEFHPWNRSFEWTDHHGSSRVVTPEQARQFDQEGYFLLVDAFGPELVGEIREETDRFDAETETLLKKFEHDRLMISEAGAITFSAHLVARSDRLRRFAAHPLLSDLCQDLVGPEVRLYWDQAVYKKPEKPRRFPWHQDNGYTYIEPQQYLTCWVALSDATVENGCPWVVPGVHRLGTLRHRYIAPLGFECLREPEGAVPVPARAGSVVVFSSLTPHLTGPNTSEAVRKTYILQYAPDGARILLGDPKAGPPTETKLCNAPERQFPVVLGGRRVEPNEAASSG